MPMSGASEVTPPGGGTRAARIGFTDTAVHLIESVSGLARPGAEGPERTAGTGRLLGVAGPTSVKNEPVRRRPHDASGRSEQMAASIFSGSSVSTRPRRLVTRTTWVSTPNPGLHTHCTKDVGGLPPDARQRDQFVHRAGHDPAEIPDQRPGARQDVLGLVPEETRAPDLLLEGRRIRSGVVRGGAVRLEERRRDLIHAHIGALGRQDRRDQKLQRRGETESQQASGSVRRGSPGSRAAGPAADRRALSRARRSPSDLCVALSSVRTRCDRYHGDEIIPAVRIAW